MDRNIRRIEIVSSETKAGQKKRSELEEAGYGVCGVLETATPVCNIIDGLSWELLELKTAVQNLVIDMEDVINGRKK